jgi:hypothetical protein
MSSYIIYSKEQLQKYYAAGNKFNADVLKKIGAQWRALSDQQKAVSIAFALKRL